MHDKSIPSRQLLKTSEPGNKADEVTAFEKERIDMGGSTIVGTLFLKRFCRYIIFAPAAI